MAQQRRRKDEQSCAGYCDSCQKPCMGLHEAGSVDAPGILCYHCRQGHFRLRALFTLMQCPRCRGMEYGCGDCSNRGVIPVPRE